jgi:hypothetical protein
MKKKYIVISYYDKKYNNRPMYFQSKDKMGTTYISDITKAFRFRTRFMANRIANQTLLGMVVTV